MSNGCCGKGVKKQTFLQPRFLVAFIRLIDVKSVNFSAQDANADFDVNIVDATIRIQATLE